MLEAVKSQKNFPIWLTTVRLQSSADYGAYPHHRSGFDKLAGHLRYLSRTLEERKNQFIIHTLILCGLGDGISTDVQYVS